MSRIKTYTLIWKDKICCRKCSVCDAFRRLCAINLITDDRWPNSPSLPDPSWCLTWILSYPSLSGGKDYRRIHSWYFPEHTEQLQIFHMSFQYWYKCASHCCLSAIDAVINQHPSHKIAKSALRKQETTEILNFLNFITLSDHFKYWIAELSGWFSTEKDLRKDTTFNVWSSVWPCTEMVRKPFEIPLINCINCIKNHATAPCTWLLMSPLRLGDHF